MSDDPPKRLTEAGYTIGAMHEPPAAFPPEATPANGGYPRSHFVANANRDIDALEKLAEELGDAVESMGTTLGVLLRDDLPAPPRDYFAVPEVVAYQLRDALAGVIGWLASLHPTASRIDELRRALEALSRHANPGARRFGAPPAGELLELQCTTCGGSRNEHDRSARCGRFT